VQRCVQHAIYTCGKPPARSARTHFRAANAPTALRRDARPQAGRPCRAAVPAGPAASKRRRTPRLLPGHRPRPYQEPSRSSEARDTALHATLTRSSRLTASRIICCGGGGPRLRYRRAGAAAAGSDPLRMRAAQASALLAPCGNGIMATAARTCREGSVLDCEQRLANGAGECCFVSAAAARRWATTAGDGRGGSAPSWRTQFMC